MYSKFHQDRKGEKHLKSGVNKVSGEVDTNSRPISGEFQTVKTSDQK